jgi:hypothetical protein
MFAIVLLAKDIPTKIITQQSNTPNNTNPTINKTINNQTVPNHWLCKAEHHASN